MCGLFGWQFHKMPTKRKRIVLASVLGLEMIDRGRHSWGFYAPLTKTHSRGVGSIAQEGIIASLAKHNSVMAHTRHATHGDVTEANAHPFALSHIVGAHNGIVYNHDRLNKLHNRSFEVDSIHIFAHLQEMLPLDQIDAYGAVSYSWIGKPESIHLSRFNGGELAVAETEYGVVWASTESAVINGCNLAGIKAEFYHVKANHGYMATGGKLFLTESRFSIGLPSYGAMTWDGKANSKGRKADAYDLDELDELDGTDSADWEYDELTGKWRTAKSQKDIELQEYEEWTDSLSEEELKFLDEHGKL